MVQSGTTALLSASLKGNTSTLELLLGRGAKIDHVDNVSLRRGGHGTCDGNERWGSRITVFVYV